MTLHPSIAERIRETHKRIVADGDLPSREQLASFRDNFRARFGPDQIAELDGKALLETLHNHGDRASLVYWLEFKNDDEYSATHFGSIAGGSALKFGIYRRRETGAWMTGNPREQVELSVADAIATARKHRDQLLAGVEVFRRLPTSVDYDALQEQLEAVAPDVAELAWGHKYFAMLFPDIIDDFHAPSYQKFHLLKMLKRPPSKPGRYRAAVGFVEAARELELDMSSLTSALNACDGNPYRYWRIGTGPESARGREWPAMRDGAFVSLGWGFLGSLGELANSAQVREELVRRLRERSPEKPEPVLGKNAAMIHRFVTKLQVGDVVVAVDGSRVLGIGRVKGAYEFADGSEFGHHRPVEWIAQGRRGLEIKEGLRVAFKELKNDDSVLALERAMLELGSEPEHDELPPATVRPTPALRGISARIEAALERKRQVILFGPPGTGKTYHAELAAQELAARQWFQRSWDQLSDGDRGDLAGAIQMCTFHAAYGYEDFIEGYRPREAGGGLSFECRDGIFKRLCSCASEHPSRSFFLIIDEINRGDVPRVFGELLTVLEKGRRGRSVVLPLSGRAFSVPSNVFLIATMNTADRSIALLDAALRRRFSFIELMPDSRLLEGATIHGIPLRPWLDALNARLLQHLGRDARNLQVGHAYFMHEERPIQSMARFAAVMQDDVIPLLEEYCYDNPEALSSILGTRLVRGEYARIDDSLFDPARFDELRTALLQPCPEIAASQQAVASDAEQVVDENEVEDEEPSEP